MITKTENIGILGLGSLRKGRNYPFVRSEVVNEERMI